MAVESFPSIDGDSVAWISRDEMVEIDRIMIEDLHIGLLQMMENAGRNLARLVLELSSPPSGRPLSVAVYVGKGGNGGGGLVAARHLSNTGVEVVIVATAPPESMSDAAALQFDIDTRIGIATSHEPVIADVAIDALIGYSLRGAPTGRSAALIDAIAGSATTLVSLDTPSGLNVTTGSTPGVVVDADVTMTLALPKVGLRSAPEVGDLYLADISVPPAVTSGHGETPDFSESGIVRVRR